LDRKRLSFTRATSKPKISPFKSLEDSDRGKDSERDKGKEKEPAHPVSYLPSFSSSPNSFVLPASPESVTESLERTSFMKLMYSVPHMSIFEGDPSQKGPPKTPTGTFKPTETDMLDQFKKMRDEFDLFSNEVATSYIKQSQVSPVKFDDQNAQKKKLVGFEVPPGNTPLKGKGSSPSPSPFSAASLQPQAQSLPASQQPFSRGQPFRASTSLSDGSSLEEHPAGIPIAASKGQRPQVDNLREDDLRTQRPLNLRDFGIVDEDDLGGSLSDEFNSSTDEIFPIQGIRSKSTGSDDGGGAGGGGSTDPRSNPF